MESKSVGRVTIESLRVSSIEEPGWHSEPGRIPEVGEQVRCADGFAEVMVVLGRISDGSRLLELRLSERSGAYFASSSNVLVRTAAAGA